VLNRARHKPLTERNVLQIGDLEVDLDRREVRREGQPLALTPTEFRLMEVLARNAGKAVAETELVREVWGAYRQENTTTVRRYIFLLRKKVEPQPDEPRYIVTVRGYGYRLEGG